MNRPPAWQCYAKDILSSKAIAVMTLAEVGAYFLLLNHCWDTDDCTLPNDDRELAILSRMGEAWHSYGSAIHPVRKCFMAHPSKPGRLINERMYAEWKKLKAFQAEKSKAGQKGAKSRWKETKSPSWHSHAPAIGLPLAKGMANDSSSSSSSSSRENPSVGSPYEGEPVLRQGERTIGRKEAERILSEMPSHLRHLVEDKLPDFEEPFSP